MLQYSDIKVGDIVKMVGEAAPGYAESGEYARVVAVQYNGCTLNTRDDREFQMVFKDGASRMEATDYKGPFPEWVLGF